MSKRKEDRIGCYLLPHVEEFVFDELSDSYLDRAGIADILMGVPIPIRKTAMTGLTTLDIARNMAFVIGCDPNFDYTENYIAYILRVFGKKFAEGLVGDGVDAAQKNDYDYACIQFRAAMQIDPENVDALYCYGRACKDSYELGEDEEFVGRYKAEALEAFEQVTIRRPDFAEGFYFLGYGYVNLGLYMKAKLTWEEYMRLTEPDVNAAGSDEASAAPDEAPADSDEASAAPDEASAAAKREQTRKLREEIRMRLDSLKEPVEIEKGYNMVLSGRYAEGIEKLSEYKEGKFADWWPLWYYLGVAYNQLSEIEARSRIGSDGSETGEACEGDGNIVNGRDFAQKAAEHFLHVLKLSPSNIETMEELVGLYRRLGDTEKADKYERKIRVVKDNAAQDRAEARAAAEAAAAAPTASDRLN